MRFIADVHAPEVPAYAVEQAQRGFRSASSPEAADAGFAGVGLQTLRPQQNPIEVAMASA